MRLLFLKGLFYAYYGTDFIDTNKLSIDETKVVTAMRKNEKIRKILVSIAEEVQ